MLSLLRQRCMFSMGETQDARELSSIADGRLRRRDPRRPPSRAARVRMTPDTIFNLPNHHAVCSWISRGARVPGLRRGRRCHWRPTRRWCAHHLRGPACARQHTCPTSCRTRCRTSRSTPRDLPIEVMAGEAAQHAPRRTRTARDGRPRAQPIAPTSTRPRSTTRTNARARAAARRAGQLHRARLRRRARADLGQGHGHPVGPSGTSRRNASWRSSRRFTATGSCFATQIWRRWWPGSSLRAAQQGLNRMAKAGLGAPLPVPARRARRPAARVLPAPRRVRARPARTRAARARTSTRRREVARGRDRRPAARRSATCT